MQYGKEIEMFDGRETGMPKGYVKLPATEAWTNGKTLVILGEPTDTENEELGHNCDQMGCGSVGSHVIAIGTYSYGDPLRFQTVRQIMEHYGVLHTGD